MDYNQPMDMVGSDTTESGDAVDLSSTAAGSKEKGETLISAVMEGTYERAGVYTRLAYPSQDTGGITKLVQNIEGMVLPTDVSKYWDDHTYKSTGAAGSKFSVTGGQSGIIYYSQNGLVSIQEYGSLSISNLALEPLSPNKHYDDLGDLTAYYYQNQMASVAEPKEADHSLNTSGTSEYDPDKLKSHALLTKGIDSAIGRGLTIYDPITVENDHVIGAQVGKFATEVEDDTQYDQRVTDSGDRLNQNKVDPYVVQSRKLYTWISPIGNFSALGGTGGDGAESGYRQNGWPIRTHDRVGYVDNMNIDKWLDNIDIHYPFVAGIEHSTNDIVLWPFYNPTTGTYVYGDQALITHGYPYDGSVIRPTYTGVDRLEHLYAGSSGITGAMAAFPNDTLDTKVSWDVKFGNAVSATNTCNIVEAKNAEVVIRAFAINASPNGSGATIKYMTAHHESNIDDRCNSVDKVDHIDLVGSIGNISIHDVTDFRFSEYFKEIISPDRWLMPGLIHEVDDEKPKAIVSSEYDIMFKEVTDQMVANGIGHATLGRDKYYYMDDDELKGPGGMAGEFNILPLTPAMNPNQDYDEDALRLGYKVYESVDTIGNYQSSIKGAELPEGPGDTDTRDYYLEVNSVYMLYDLDTGKMYDIDVWSGSSGSKERLYNGTTLKSEAINIAGAIYQDVKQEEGRRNISAAERAASIKVTDDPEFGLADPANGYPTYKHSEIHYIGTAGHLKLDNRDLSYNGSEHNLSLNMSWGSNTYKGEGGTTINGQRYHFIDGLTSTSIITPPLGDTATTWEAISAANTNLQAKHPNAVIVQFQTFTAKGTEWTLTQRSSLVNQTKTATVYKDGTSINYSPKAPVYKLSTDDTTETVIRSFDPEDKYVPIVVMEAWHSAAEDRSTQGTH